MAEKEQKPDQNAIEGPQSQDGKADRAEKKPVETGGRKGPEPTRYGDWEKNGIISDF